VAETRLAEVAQIVDEFSVDTGAPSLMLRDELERLMQKDEVLPG